MDKEAMPTAAVETAEGTREREQNAIASLREQLSQKPSQEKLKENLEASMKATTNEKMGKNAFQTAKDYIAAERQKKAEAETRTTDIAKAEYVARAVNGNRNFALYEKQKKDIEANAKRQIEGSERHQQLEKQKNNIEKSQNELIERYERVYDEKQEAIIEKLLKLANGEVEEASNPEGDPYTQEDGKLFAKAYEECMEKQKENVESHEKIIEMLEIDPDDNDEVIDTKIKAIEMAVEAIQKIEREAKVRALRVFEARKRIAAIKAKRVKPSAKDASPQAASAGYQMPGHVID